MYVCMYVYIQNLKDIYIYIYIYIYINIYIHVCMYVEKYQLKPLPKIKNNHIDPLISIAQETFNRF